jgi:dihydroneopterin triphosphate diphosphatase
MNYKRPESVLIVVYTTAGDVLLLRRVWPTDFWQSVTGSLRWNETDPLVTARRELAEETGLRGALPIVDCGWTRRFPIKPEWRARYGPGVSENLEHVFRLELPEPWPIVLSPREHGEYVWLPRDRAAELTASWTNRDAILRCVPVARSAQRDAD